MKKLVIIICLFFVSNFSFSQTLNWNTATRTGTAPNYTYTGTGIKAVITSNAVTLSDGTPRVDGTSGSGACYINPSLALYTAFFNSYSSGTNSNITVTFYFAGGFGCSDVTLIIKDINSGESFTDFCDVLELSATYGNSGTTLPAANITTTLASNVNRSVSGSVVKLVGHNSSNETIGSYSTGSACGNTSIKFAAPAGSPLNTFTIKYRPAYGTSSSNAYYSSGTHPAAQYVSIGNLSFVTSVGCTVLPIELLSFAAKRTDNIVKVNWQTASEKNNDFFTIERSLDGVTFEEIKRVKGSANSYELKNYEANDENPSAEISYYRLKQTDVNGQLKYSDMVSVDEDNSMVHMSDVYPNPTSSNVDFDFYTPFTGELICEITDYTGRVLISKSQLVEVGYSKINTLIDDLPNGIYFFKVSFDKTNLISVNKIFKN